MANTIAEYGYLSTSPVLKGIIKTIVNESPFLARMPFREIAGNSLLYNLETTEAGINNYVTGDTWAESTTVWAQRNVALTILGGDADVDSFAKQTRSNEQDVTAAIIELKAKALADKFEKLAIVGYTSTTYSTKEMKGLMRLLAECETSTASLASDWDAPNNAQLVAASSTSGALTIDLLDQLRDCVKPKPDCFIMSRRMRRKLQSLARTSGDNYTYIADPRKLGHVITMFGEQEVIISDFVPDNILDAAASITAIASYVQATTRATTVDNSVIFALRWDENDGVAGVTNGWIQTEDFDKLETKDASRTRIKLYSAMACFGNKCLAGLVNVIDTAS